jgi:pyruvate dehydrogenase E2 component (dihydrolipoamide acetyltransferase)
MRPSARGIPYTHEPARGYVPLTVEPSTPAAHQSGLKGETRVEEPDRAQRAIARRTAETRATVPDLELASEIEMGAVLSLAAELRCSTTAMLVRACALALRDHPYANAAYRDGRYELYSRVNVGVAIQTEDAYVIPTVLDADSKTPAQLSQELEALAARAQAGALTPPQLAGATFTVSDLSAHRVHRWSALITPPQAAALTAGAIRPAAVVRNGALAPGHMMSVTLACDHRILFGARAAALLERIVERLERGAP